MFEFEKEMMPVLKLWLSENYREAKYVDEFHCGRGIADLVFTKDTLSERMPSKFLDYDFLYIVYGYLNRKNKRVDLNDLTENTFLTSKKVKLLADLLVDRGVLSAHEGGGFFVSSKYSPPIKSMFSIEAKLSDWKSGIFQAKRYQSYSHKSYLAISKEFIHRVDEDALRRENIGLIEVSPDDVKIKIDVRAAMPEDRITHACMSERMAMALVQ